MSFGGIGIDGTDVRQQPDGAELPLTRQPSIYSLTFDEFQSTKSGIGKDFGSMNMDEFLKNIWTAEESHVMAASLGPPNGGTSCAHPGLQRQGSLTLPRTLSQKTVDEVWRDLSRESAGGVGGSEFQQQQQQQQQQRQPTLGEMTLEEFLVRAGVVREEISIPGPPGISIDNNANISNGAFYGNSSSITSGHSNNGLSLGFSQAVGCSNIAMASTGTRPFATQLPMASNVNFGSSQGLRGGEIIGIGDSIINNGMTSEMVSLGGGGNIVTSVSPASQVLSDGLSKGNGDLSSLSPVPYVFNGSLRGRKCNGTVEKVVERRQRRMIKNRESAARSRARKQAYTMELETEVAKLKEQNQELQKKQAVIMELQKNQALLEASNQQREAKQPCLRRTATGPW